MRPGAFTLGLALAVLSGCARPRGSATVPTPVRVETIEWTLWAREGAGGLVPCPSPCTTLASDGSVAVIASDRGSSWLRHEVWLPVDQAMTLEVGRWSHEGERILGGVLLGLGVLVAALPPLLVAAASPFDLDGSGTPPEAVAIFSVPPGLVLAGTGIGLFAWNDTLTTRHAGELGVMVTPTDGGAVASVSSSF